MGNQLYDENRRLKAENEGLRQQLRQGREQDDHADAAARVLTAIDAFFADKAVLRIDHGNYDEKTLYVSFQLKTPI